MYFVRTSDRATRRSALPPGAPNPNCERQASVHEVGKENGKVANPLRFGPEIARPMLDVPHQYQKRLSVVKPPPALSITVY
jgi:hypothetical protein